MQWITISAAKTPVKHKRSIEEEVANLSLRQQTKIQKFVSFNQQTFKSTFLPQTFKNYHYTDLTSLHPDKNQDDTITQFMLILPTQYTSVLIFLTISVDIGKQFIKYSSYPAKNAQMYNFTNQQITALGRIFSLHLNSHLQMGWLSTDPQSGCLNYKHTNNSLGFLERRIQKVPEELSQHLLSEVKELQKNWRKILPSIFNLLDINQRKKLSHPFWKTPKKPINHYQTPDFNLLSEYVKHSFIEYPQMFDQSLTKIQGKKIRSKYLSWQQKNKKHLSFRNNKDNLNFISLPLNKDINQVLKLFTQEKVVQKQRELVKKQLPQQKVAELSTHLFVNNYESKNQIHSEIKILQVLKEQDLSRSAFSELKLLFVSGQRKQQKQPSMQRIVSKRTDQHRFINQTEILKYMGQGKSLFMTRYFHNPQKQNQILLEYCQQKSINAYIVSNRKIISFQTKMVLLNRIALGIRFLRDYGIHHNDIKPQNVLLKMVGNKANNNVILTRLIDFGQSYSKYQRDLIRKNWYHRGWTVPYAPPEQVRYAKYSQKTDVFSIGVMMFQFVFGTFPVEAFRKGKQLYMKQQTYQKICSMNPQNCKDYSCPKLMQVVYHLFLRCIHPNPEHRPSIDWICIILKDIVLMAEKISSY